MGFRVRIYGGLGFRLRIYVEGGFTWKVLYGLLEGSSEDFVVHVDRISERTPKITFHEDEIRVI